MFYCITLIWLANVKRPLGKAAWSPWQKSKSKNTEGRGEMGDKKLLVWTAELFLLVCASWGSGRKIVSQSSPCDHEVHSPYLTCVILKVSISYRQCILANVVTTVSHSSINFAWCGDYQTLCLCSLPEHSASADNSDLGIVIS